MSGSSPHSELAGTVRKTLLHSQHAASMVDGSPSFFDPALEALASLEEQLEALDLDNARLRNALRRIADAPWKSATVTGDIARNALDRAANPYPAISREGE